MDSTKNKINFDQINLGCPPSRFLALKYLKTAAEFAEALVGHEAEEDFGV